MALLHVLDRPYYNSKWFAILKQNTILILIKTNFLRSLKSGIGKYLKELFSLRMESHSEWL